MKYVSFLFWQEWVELIFLMDWLIEKFLNREQQKQNENIYYK
jgi:hypothetical protein